MIDRLLLNVQRAIFQLFRIRTCSSVYKNIYRNEGGRDEPTGQRFLADNGNVWRITLPLGRNI